MRLSPAVGGSGSGGCWPRRSWLGLPVLLVALLAVFAVPAAALQPGCSQSGQTVTCAYTSGSNPFTVPAGVSSIHVAAIGGTGNSIGGAPFFGAGGHGAAVSGDLPVNSGATLYAVVGAGGGAGTGLGGFGGGASDVRTSQNGLSSRVLVAAGGGGGGGTGGSGLSGDGHTFDGNGGAGGASGGDAGFGGAPSGGGGGGGGGSSSNGGAGGAGGSSCNPFVMVCGAGANGSAGANGFGGDGGAGATFGQSGPPPGQLFISGGDGGGGGGGWFGGGGGGGGGLQTGGGGGGGGSNLVPAGGSQSIDTTEIPLVQISYRTPKHVTATAVSCSPNTFAPGDATVCTATVTDTASGEQSTPTGTVSFTNSGAGGFGGSPCTLAGSGASASCAVFFGSFPRSGQVITASYGGDATHAESIGRTLVLVAVPASTDGCLVFGHGRIIAANGDKASFRGLAIAAPPRGAEFYRDNGPGNPMRVRSASVDAVTCNPDATRASVYGKATINGAGSVEYRIDIQIAASKGGKDTYRIRLSNGYDSGAQPIRHGDVDIRLRSSQHGHHDPDADQNPGGDNQDGG
jgi:hypothetical protein